MRILVAGAATALLTALPGPSVLAQDPCAADVERLCPDVKAGSGRVTRCLREKRDSASAGCRAKLDSDELRARRLIEEFGRACRVDIDDYCPDIEPGGGRVLGCLAQNQLVLTPPCQAELGRVAEARERVAAIREACAAEAKILCKGVPPLAGPLLECLQANEPRLSSACSGAELRRAMEAARFVDVLEELKSQDRVLEAIQILQGIDSVAFSRSQVLLQFDSYQGLGGDANGSRFLFNPQFVFGAGHQFALQVKVPVRTLYPWTATDPPQSGLGEITTAFAWNVASHGGLRHYLSLGVQWETAADKALGAPWAMQPAYAVAMGLARWLSLTTQVVWIRSFGSAAYPEVDLLLLEPILVANLPGRSFLSLDTKLEWNLIDGNFVPLMKGVAGIFTDRHKSVSIAAWYQAPLTSAAVAQSFEFELGLGLAYFFDW